MQPTGTGNQGSLRWGPIYLCKSQRSVRTSKHVLGASRLRRNQQGEPLPIPANKKVRWSATDSSPLSDPTLARIGNSTAVKDSKSLALYFQNEYIHHHNGSPLKVGHPAKANPWLRMQPACITTAFTLGWHTLC